VALPFLIKEDLGADVELLGLLGSAASLAGWGTELLGAPAVFLIWGIGVVLLVLLGLSHPAIRNLD